MLSVILLKIQCNSGKSDLIIETELLLILLFNKFFSDTSAVFIKHKSLFLDISMIFSISFSLKMFST